MKGKLKEDERRVLFVIKKEDQLVHVHTTSEAYVSSDGKIDLTDVLGEVCQVNQRAEASGEKT